MISIELSSLLNNEIGIFRKTIVVLYYLPQEGQFPIVAMQNENEKNKRK